MDNNANGWSGAEINYGGVNPAEVLMQGAQLKERRKERQDELEMQRMRLQREDDDKKYTWAQNATDPSKYISGQTAIDQHAQGALGDVMDKILHDPNFHSENLGQLMAQYLPAIQSVAQGHIIGKQLLEKGYKQIDDVSKDNPNINTSALKQHLFDQVGQTVLDNEGNYRSPDKIDVNRDIVGGVLDSPDAWQFSNGASKMINNLRTLKGDKVNAITQQHNGTIVTHEGYITPFQQQDWSVLNNGYSNKLPQFSLKTQPITLPDGKVAQALDDKTFDENFGESASKEDKMQFDYLWNSYKQHAGLQTNPQSEGYAKRIFAAQLVKDNVQNQMQQVHAEHLPKQGNTTINMGNTPPTYNLYKDMVTAAQNYPNGAGKRPHGAAPLNQLNEAGRKVALAAARANFGKVQEKDRDVPRDINYGDIDVQYRNGTLYVRRVTKDDKGHQYLTGDEFPMSEYDVNSYINGSVKQDEQLLAQGNETAATPHPTYTQPAAKPKETHTTETKQQTTIIPKGHVR